MEVLGSRPTPARDGGPGFEPHLRQAWRSWGRGPPLPGMEVLGSRPTPARHGGPGVEDLPLYLSPTWFNAVGSMQIPRLADRMKMTYTSLQDQ
ncbi:unnamed protein product [Merluccius merluccius]